MCIATSGAHSSTLEFKNYKEGMGIINNVGRTSLLGLPRNQNGRHIGYITLLSLIYRGQNVDFLDRQFMTTSLRSTTDGKATCS